MPLALNSKSWRKKRRQQHQQQNWFREHEHKFTLPLRKLMCAARVNWYFVSRRMNMNKTLNAATLHTLSTYWRCILNIQSVVLNLCARAQNANSDQNWKIVYNLVIIAGNHDHMSVDCVHCCLFMCSLAWSTSPSSSSNFIFHKVLLHWMAR